MMKADENEHSGSRSTTGGTHYPPIMIDSIAVVLSYVQQWRDYRTREGEIIHTN